MTPDVRRAAVLGSPIAHSLSPVLHRAAYRDLGLGWRYDAVDVTEDGLAAFVAGCDAHWAGLSLTMPLKRAVLPLLDTRTRLVDVVGAANTVVFGADGERVGHNTDVAGIVAALRGVAPPEALRGIAPPEARGGIAAPAGRAVVLGGGATAASALAALGELGCAEVQLYARRPAVAAAKLDEVAARVRVALSVRGWPEARERLPAADEVGVVVSTAPAAAGATLAVSVPDRPGVLLDVSYDPWPPVLVQAWRAAGGAAVAGDEMLLHQAVAQVVLMTGRTPRIDAMRTALRAAIAERG